MFDASYVPQLALRLADFACACLAETPNGPLANCGLYHGPAPADCCNSLTVSLERPFPSKGVGVELAGPTRCGVSLSVEFLIRWWRPCWPTAKDDPWSPFPPSSETTVAAANLIYDAIALECCLLADLNAIQSTVLGPTLQMVPFRVGRAERPGPPKGGCAGWDLRVWFELPSCCEDPLGV